MCFDQSKNGGYVGGYQQVLIVYIHCDRHFGPDHFIKSQRAQASLLIVVQAVFSNTSFDRTAQLPNSTNNFRLLQLVKNPVTKSAKWPTVSQVRVIEDSCYFLVTYVVHMEKLHFCVCVCERTQIHSQANGAQTVPTRQPHHPKEATHPSPTEAH